MEKDLTPIYGYLARFKAEPQEDLDAYKTELETKELMFRQCITECIVSEQTKVLLMVKEDLEEVIKCNSEKWKPTSDKDKHFQMQCAYVAGKAKDALDYIRKVEAKYVNGASAMQSSTVVEADNDSPNVLSGTDGLAEYLGCSHNKAFDIIKSRVLPKSVQYQTGRVWKFNRKKLDAFIEEHPEALGRVREGGIVD